MTSSRIRAAAFLLAGGAAVLLFLTHRSDLRDLAGWDRAPDRQHLLVVTLDTTRWDRLGCNGRRLGDLTATPNLDRLADEGVLFRRAYVPVPLTLPSHVSIFTGLEPPRHGVRENEGFVLPPRAGRSFETLAEILAGRGFDTAAFLSAEPLAAGCGLEAGFGVYDDVRGVSGGRHHFTERGADETTDRALAWLDGLDSAGSFLWVHYFDPHAPYLPHDGRAKRVAEAFGHRYDGEIAFMDAQLGRLLDAYRERGWWDDTLVVAVADHGEGLGEHDEATHGLLAHDSTLRVPLIIKPPSAETRPIASGLARSVDILPTILDVMGPRVARDTDGVSLIGSTPTTAYAETMYPFRQYGWAALRAWIDGDSKIIEGGGRVELYDLAADPSETRDLAAVRPADAARLRRRLRAHVAGLEKAFRVDTRTDLRGVAYSQVESSTVPAEPGRDENDSLPHPAERMVVVAMLDRLRAALNELVRDDVPAAQDGFTTAQYLEGRLAEADPDSPAVLFWRGRALWQMAARGGRLTIPESGRREMTDRALEAFRELLAVRPRDARTRDMVLMVGLVRHELGVEGALESVVEEAAGQIGLGLADGLTWALKAKAHEGLGERDAAVECLGKAVERAPERRAFRADLDRLRPKREPPDTGNGGE